MKLRFLAGPILLVGLVVPRVALIADEPEATPGPAVDTIPGSGPASAAGSERLAPPPWRVAAHDLIVRREPSASSRRRGEVRAGGSFGVLDTPAVPGPGCSGGWLAARGDGWVCSDDTAPSDAPPGYPTPPTPPPDARFDDASDLGRAPADTLPLLYARPRPGAPRHEYATPQRMIGGQPVDELEPGAALRFQGVRQTELGALLVRPDGHLVRPDDVIFYGATPFAGLTLAGLPDDGRLPGWATAHRGMVVRTAPELSAGVSWVAPWHLPLWLSEPQAGEPAWWKVDEVGGEGPPGWAYESPGLRRWLDAPPPDGVGEELWVDVVLSQQVLAVRQGDRVLGVTLVSTGREGHPTPTGVHRLRDKARWWDMHSQEGSEESWHVEGVPWTMHFRTMYALHGTFWHDELGRVRSHGCVNLSPADSRLLFDLLSPELPPGWHAVWPTEDHPGAVVRIRQGVEVVPDLR